MVLQRYKAEELRASDRRMSKDKRLDRRSGSFLGPLLVDFDDLRDLAEVIRPPDASGDEPLDLRFETGHATQIDDLCQLHDAELDRGVTMSCGDTTVTLKPSRTMVRGPLIKVIAVRMMWARFRRTQAWPRYGPYFWITVVSLVFGVGTIAYSLMSRAIDHPGSPKTNLSTLFFCLAVIGPPAMFYWRAKIGSTVFFPGTRQERREDRPLARRHRFQMTLTVLGSIVIPLISLIVTALKT